MTDPELSLSASRGIGRLLTFEVNAHIYALPIGGILEVAEAGTICGVPTLPRSLAGVMNWHGEALPIVATRLVVTVPEDDRPDAVFGETDPALDADDGADVAAAIFGAANAPALEATQVLVISGRNGESAELGLPIDSVLGLVDGSGRSHLEVGNHVVVERRSVDGRVVSVMDPRRVVARANHVIERLAA